MPEMMQSLMNPVVLWLLVGVVLMILEFSAPGLVIGFFGFGAVATAVVCVFLDLSLGVQILVFTLFSVISLAVLRSAFKPLVSGKEGEMDSDVHEYEGRKACVTQPITPGKPGKVEFQGSEWSAVSERVIEAGEQVTIVSRDNLTLNVN